jgi:hypothetical protein
MGCDIVYVFVVGAGCCSAVNDDSEQRFERLATNRGLRLLGYVYYEYMTGTEVWFAARL